MHGIGWIGFQSPPLLEKEGGKKNLQIESEVDLELNMFMEVVLNICLNSHEHEYKIMKGFVALFAFSDEGL